ncbi:ABR135Cp [Eremothecium gossypii ATCC 10895]|uniref:ABR135Cp n=1 Tax=Eremothecium gossypii (strain ATCC 10895 / CBS 109.51 / FGSC 9923 / NRRL Y-1056) TaxID=284811 RepID=Q75D89_EREGS|nr:ABR135Cp [Eremothecium gossypii ATCC 10895]AAS50906.1 ABR135Cp [Eremothecium gossypii ATCC 10895]AEY95195.1 FABR135Cp [Eremothecium gossypii FDAG1]
MSVSQVRQSVSEILGLNAQEETPDWNSGRLKRMAATTATLYNVSLNKVMLKQPEEIARCHICAYLAAEKLSEKYEPELQYYREKIPLEPRKTVKLVGLFKQTLWTSSPVRNLNLSPSPKKDGGRLSARDPVELRAELFGTPVKRAGAVTLPGAGELSPTKQLSPSKPMSPVKPSPRRRLAFEDEDEDYEPDASPQPSPRRSIFPGGFEPDPDESEFDSPTKSPFKSPTRSPTKSAQSSPRKKRGEYNQWNMLYKKYYRITPEEIVGLCNQFELPSRVAFQVLDCFGMHATYLVYPAQLVCGLVMLCCFVVHHRKRASDPTIDDYLLKKMCALLRSNSTSDVLEAMKITKELLDGENWYRALKIEYDYYDAADFEQSLAIRLGSMLQNSNVIASTEQFEEWKKKVMLDLSLRDGS